MQRPRLVVAFVVLLFVGLTLAGTYYVRRCVFEQALRVVFKSEDEEQIAALVKCWPSPVNVEVDNNYTVLQWAVWEGKTELAKLCVEKGARLNRVAPPTPGCPWRMTPIQVAIYRRDLDVIESLIAHGADVNLTKGTTGSGPLLMAARHGDAQITGLLIAAGADVNVRDEDGRTPLALAEEKGCRDVVRLLRAHGAK